MTLQVTHGKLREPNQFVVSCQLLDVYVETVCTWSHQALTTVTQTFRNLNYIIFTLHGSKLSEV